MKKIILASAIFLFTTNSFAAPCENFVYNNTFPKVSEKETILCKNGFVIGYSTEKKTLLWVAEKIEPSTQYIIKKRDAFHKDSSVPSSSQSSNSDFVGTGYDKGHMVPFEDMTFSKESAYDSMSLTNIVPQNYQNNRGGWKALEMQARKMALKGPIFVVSGPIFEGKTDYLNGNVPIPSKLFKVIIDPSKQESITYILPNTPISAYEVSSYIFTKKDIHAVDVTPSANLKDTK